MTEPLTPERVVEFDGETIGTVRHAPSIHMWIAKPVDYETSKLRRFDHTREAAVAWLTERYAKSLAVTDADTVNPLLADDSFNPGLYR